MVVNTWIKGQMVNYNIFSTNKMILVTDVNVLVKAFFGHIFPLNLKLAVTSATQSMMLINDCIW